MSEKTKLRSVRIDADKADQLDQLGVNFNELVREAVDQLLEQKKCPLCNSRLKKPKR